jgi:hypothetical protein
MDFIGNCPDTSGPSRELSSALREMFPANCSDTARQLLGECPDDSSVAARIFHRTLRGMLLGHCATCCLSFM